MRTRLFSGLLAACGSVVFAASMAQGAVVPIVNGNFEQVYTDNTLATPVTVSPVSYSNSLLGDPTNFYGFGRVNLETPAGPVLVYVPGWVGTGEPGYDGIEILGAPYYTNETGIAGYVGSSLNGKMEQILTTDLAANTTYTLSLNIGKRSDYGNRWGAADYTVKLFAGATELALTGTQANPTAGTFAAMTLTYTSPGSVTAGQALKIEFASLLAPDQQVGIDNVTLDASSGIPEPTTLSLLGLAGLSLMRRRR